MEWNDVDFNAKTILMRQGFILGQMEDTKTSKELTVSLNSVAFAALKRQKAGRSYRKAVGCSTTQQRMNHGLTSRTPDAGIGYLRYGY